VGDLKVHDYSPTENIDRWVQASLTIQGKIGDFDLVSSSGYFRARSTTPATTPIIRSTTTSSARL
jgi:hypothetical protein